MLDIFSIVIQQLTNIRHDSPLIGIIKRNQRRRTGVLHLFLLTGVPDAGNRLNLHRALNFKARISRQRGDAVVLLLQALDPLLTRPRRDGARRLQALFQLRQNFIPGEVFNDVLIRPAEAQRGGVTQYGQRAVGIKGN